MIPWTVVLVEVKNDKFREEVLLDFGRADLGPADEGYLCI